MSVSAYGFGQSSVDSLENMLGQAKNEKKIKILNELANSTLRS